MKENDRTLKHMNEVLDLSGSRCVLSIKENGEIGPKPGLGLKVSPDGHKTIPSMLDRTKGVGDLGKGQIVARATHLTWPKIKPLRGCSHRSGCC